MKLIRRTLSEWDKKRVQPKLQAAYKNNGDGFYVNAPKRSKTKLKGLLEYIKRIEKSEPKKQSKVPEKIQWNVHDVANAMKSSG